MPKYNERTKGIHTLEFTSTCSVEDSLGFMQGKREQGMEEGPKERKMKDVRKAAKTNKDGKKLSKL